MNISTKSFSKRKDPMDDVTKALTTHKWWRRWLPHGSSTCKPSGMGYMYLFMIKQFIATENMKCQIEFNVVNLAESHLKI